MTTYLALAALIASLTSLVLNFVKRKEAGVSSRLLTLEHIAAKAAGVGEQLGKTPYEKLRHAVDAAQHMDLSDNGVRDYTDSELRIAIEAHLGSTPSKEA